MRKTAGERASAHGGLLCVSILAFACGCSAVAEPQVDGEGNRIDPQTKVSEAGDGDDSITIDNTPPVGAPDDSRTESGVGVREQVCDDAGNCTCLRLALLGTLDTAASDKDTSAFQAWLNDNSGGSATVQMVTTKPSINAEFLASYDILIVANVNGWSFSEAEKSAVVEWSAGGGGIIAITGFESTVTESTSSSQLIGFSGLGFSGSSESQFSANNGQSIPVYYKEGSEDLKNCLAWTGSSDAIITTPIRFTHQTGTFGDLTFELDYVGAFIGWGVTGPPEATVLATDPVSGQNMAMAMEVGGAGRVLAFGDEWIIFANQWEPTGSSHNTQEDEYNICYHMPEASDPETFFHSVQTLYQTKQFWYNAITWVAPPNECHFVVQDEDVVVIR